jgi:hypothetical protein
MFAGSQPSLIGQESRLSSSGEAVHRISASAGQEAFFEGHTHAFRVMAGVPGYEQRRAGARLFVLGQRSLGVVVMKTWLITGASRGFGHEWTEAALERGDKVAATARRIETLDALVDTYGDAVLPIQLDVTDRAAGFDAVKDAADHFGGLDVVINNAGYGHFGMIEELTEDDVRS